MQGVLILENRRLGSGFFEALRILWLASALDFRLWVSFLVSWYASGAEHKPSGHPLPALEPKNRTLKP